jgi:GTPase SAR1 family protein
VQEKKVTTKHQASPPSLDVILQDLEKALERLNTKGEKETALLETVRSLRDTLNSPLLVTVLGEFSSGKSTFINAILGEKLLPMKQRETTATITILQHGTNRRMAVHYKDGRIEHFDLSSNGSKNLETFLVENFKESDNILDMLQQVNIELNNDILRSIDIADTPGFNSEYNRHTEITTQFIKYSDLIIWLFSAKQLGKASEIKNLQEYCKIFKPIGVVNQIDRLNLRDGETVQSNLANALSKFDGLFEKFFFVSALKGLEPTNGTYTDSGIPEFLAYLNDAIIPEAKARKEKSILNKLIHIGVELNQSLSVIIKQTDEVKGKIQTIEAIAMKLQDWIAKWAQITSRWEADSQDLFKLLSNVEQYFLIADTPPSIVAKASKFRTELQELQSQYDALNQTFGQLESWQKQLESYYSDWQNRYQVYSQKGFGFKEFGDDIWEWVFGEPVSDEKRIINTMAAEFDKAKESYNQHVDKHNLQLQQTNDRASRFDESVTHFLNDVVVKAINKQFEQMQKLSEEVKSKEQEYQSLTEQLAALEKEAKTYHKQIFPIYQQAARFIGSTEHDLKKQLANFSELINYLAAQIRVSDTLDWLRIYNRTTIDKAIKLRSTEMGDVQFAAHTETAKENRQTKYV